MYYEEKFIDGELFIRTVPNGEWRRAPFTHVLKIIEFMARDLTEEERLQVFSRFCTRCGRLLESSSDHCTCMRDD